MQTINLNGTVWTLNPNDNISAHVLQGKEWEPHLTKFMNMFIKNGYCCVDVGANFGYHSLTMSKLVGGSGLVVAFEPLKENIELLKNNLQQNNIRNCIVQEVALGNRIGSTVICNAYCHDQQNIGDSFISKFHDNRIGYDDVKVDDYINKCGITLKLNKQITNLNKLDNIKIGRKINFIKIDVQGFEMNVLKGSSRVLKEDRPVIAIELEDPCSLLYGYDSGVLIDCIKSFDYCIYFLYADYPADHICVPIEQISDFEEMFDIFDHTENNDLNNNLNHGIVKKIVL